jgi:hypothetical protein
MVSDEIAHTPMPHEMYVSHIKVWYLFKKDTANLSGVAPHTVNSISTVTRTKHHFDSALCVLLVLFGVVVYAVANRLAPAPAHQQQ